MSAKQSKCLLGEMLFDFWRQTCGLKACANLYVPVAAKLQHDHYKEFEKEYQAAEKKLKSKTKKSQEKGEILLREINAKYSFWLTGDHPETLLTSQFVYLFARYDAFLGQLLEYIFMSRPEWQNGIEKTIVYKEIADLRSIADVKGLLIDKEIDSIRRDSYSDQFSTMEKKFNISTLRKFENWANFVEASQRRHLFIHCNGKVSRQYLQVCSKERYKFEEKPKVGDELKISLTYFQSAIDLVAEVALKLGSTLWRVLWKESIEDCDDFLAEVIVDIINKGEFSLAEEISSFTVSQKNISDERHQRIAIINYAQAQKWNGKNEECRKTIEKVDWSACKDDFKLAVAVLKEEWENAAKVMKIIGKNSDLIGKKAYIDWPLFREFRNTEEFRRAFKTLYRQDFSVFEAREQRPRSKG
jgi:hypothetical protein